MVWVVALHSKRAETMVLITLGAAAAVAVGGSAMYYYRRRTAQPEDMDDLDDPAVQKILECRAQRVSTAKAGARQGRLEEGEGGR